MQGDLQADIEQVNIQGYLHSQMLHSPHTIILWLHGHVGNYVVILISEKAEPKVGLNYLIMPGSRHLLGSQPTVLITAVDNSWH